MRLLLARVRGEVLSCVCDLRVARESGVQKGDGGEGERVPSGKSTKNTISVNNGSPHVKSKSTIGSISISRSVIDYEIECFF